MSDITLANSIPPEWQGAIDRLKNLPDSGWLDECRTDEQTELWHDCRMLCAFLRKLLKDFFSGRESDLSPMPKRDRDFWFLLRDRWLKFYAAIQQGWGYLRTAAAKDGVFIYETPGEMLIALLDEWALSLFSPCIIGLHPSLGGFSPRRTYTAYQQRHRRKEAVKTLKAADREMLRFMAHEVYCSSVLTTAAKSDKSLKRAVNDFLRTEAEIEAALIAMAHPRKGLQSHQWVNGRKTAVYKT